MSLLIPSSGRGGDGFSQWINWWKSLYENWLSSMPYHTFPPLDEKGALAVCIFVCGKGKYSLAKAGEIVRCIVMDASTPGAEDNDDTPREVLRYLSLTPDSDRHLDDWLSEMFSELGIEAVTPPPFPSNAAESLSARILQIGRGKYTLQEASEIAERIVRTGDGL